MEPRHQVSRAGIELIKGFEGYRRRAAQLADGRWTIGYGHLRSAREGAEVSEGDAEALLRYDLRAVEAAVNRLVFTPLTQNQFDALVAFAFNIGVDAFRRSNVLRRLNEGRMLEAASALESWRRAEFEGEPLVVDALVRRRAAEKTLFLTPPDGFVPAPSAVLKPELDFGALAHRGPTRAAEIVTPLHGEHAAAERADAGQAPSREPEPLEPSPALAAAETVSKRLQALFADDPAPEQPRPAEPQADTAAEPQAHTAGEPAQAEAPSPAVAGVSKVVSFDQRIARLDLDRPAAAPAEPTPKVEPDAPAEESGWPWLILGLIGLVLFVISVFIVIEARRAGETDLFGPQSAMGSALGLVAIAAAVAAVYFWLKTLGRDRDGDGAA